MSVAVSGVIDVALMDPSPPALAINGKILTGITTSLPRVNDGGFPSACQRSKFLY